MPYGYIISWSKLDVHYAGIRFSKNSHPTELWKKYFTSSVRVKQMREYCGEPDIIQIVSTFKTGKIALAWENEFLTTINVLSNLRWLNMHIGGKTFKPNGPGYWKGKIAHNKGIPMKEEQKKKISSNSTTKKPIVFNFVEYPSIIDAAKTLNKTERQIKWPIMRGHEGYYFKDEGQKPLVPNRGNIRSVIINGILYSSLSEAARALGVSSPNYISDRIKKGTPGYNYLN